jgi:hypothetical protein
MHFRVGRSTPLWPLLLLLLLRFCSSVMLL